MLLNINRFVPKYVNSNYSLVSCSQSFIPFSSSRFVFLNLFSVTYVETQRPFYVSKENQTLSLIPIKKQKKNSFNSFIIRECKGNEEGKYIFFSCGH